MSHYVCSGCNSRGVKLWREGNVKKVNPKCADCLGFLDQLDQNGTVYSDKTNTRSDKVGNWFPAIPIKGEDDGYWGYLAIPETDHKWWKSLSNSN